MTRNKSALIVTSEYPPETGGMGTFLSGVATGFVHRGWESMVIARRSAGSGRYDARPTGSERPRMVYRYAEIPGWDILSVFLAGLWTILRRRPSFVIVGHWYPHALIALLWRVLTGTPYFVIIHGTDLAPYNPSPLRHRVKRMIWKIMPVLLSSASGLLANSEWTREQLQLVKGVKRDHTAILHPPVDWDFFDAGGNEESAGFVRRQSLQSLHGKRVILTVGRLIPRKGVARVLEALPGILEVEPRAHYLVVGDGPERETLEARLQALGLQDAVSMVGDVPHEEISAYFAVADLFAMISWGDPEENEIETFGIVYLEANACGIPVVAGNQGGVHDAVVDGVTGLIVEPGDTQALAEAITSLLTDPDRARAMGNAGRKRALAEFTPEAIAGNAVTVIGQLLGKPELAGPN